MLITQREAARRLGAAGIGRSAATRVLVAGLAGRPTLTSSATLYEADAVEELAAWPVIDDEEAERRSPRGLFIARRDISVLTPPDVQLDELTWGWDGISFWTRALFGLDARRLGPMPLVVTVGGFVALGANLIDYQARRGVEIGLVLDRPGEWYSAFRGQRLVSGQRGRPWSIRGPGL